MWKSQPTVASDAWKAAASSTPGFLPGKGLAGCAAFCVLFLSLCAAASTSQAQESPAPVESPPAASGATPPATSETPPQPNGGSQPDGGAGGAAPAAPDNPSGNAPQDAAGNDAALSEEQTRISGQYRRFEKTLLDMAEYMRKTDPQRADLILTALRQSKEVRIQQNMEQVTKLLQGRQLGNALDRQGELVDQLKALLTLLQSEDRKSEIEREKDRLEALLKDLGRVIGREKDVRAATERGASSGQLAERQQGIADETRKLGNTIDAQDSEKHAAESAKPPQGGDPHSQGGDPQGEGSEKDPGENPSGDDQEGKQVPSNGRPSEDGGEKPSSAEKTDPKRAGEPSGGEPAESEQSQGQNSQGEESPKSGGPQSQGQQSQGRPSQGEQQGGEQQPEQGEQPPQPERTPGREELEKAREEMERAIEELKKENRDGASGHQDEAVTKLEEAKEKIEEILRQLREEERELALVALEARFQKMLAMQLAVYNGTVKLDKTPKEQWSSRHFTESRKLAAQEDDIVLDANKAFTLLAEEGSSVAFPEAVEQLRSDMLSVARLLERSETGELAQGTERDIIEALEEIVEALQQEIEKNKSQQQQQQQQQQGQPGEEQLVDTIAELKMLRSLQMRVNRRTKRLAQLTDGEQAADPEVTVQLRQLSRRQARIQEATYDLAAGRNQ